MAGILIHQSENYDFPQLAGLCPFNAIIEMYGLVRITDGCRLCRLCVKNGPPGFFEFVEDAVEKIDKKQWNGILVYVEQESGCILPVSLEIIGKAKALAIKSNQQVSAIVMGEHISHVAEQLLKYGVDQVLVYEDAAFKAFRIEPYAAGLEDGIRYVMPSIVLIGGTPIGRSLAPRVAARFRTGLTADCTSLDIGEEGDLDQIRPAFGGNIMAHIRTLNHRPQFATVRHKIFDMPMPVKASTGEVICRTLPPDQLLSRIEVREIRKKVATLMIEDAEVLVVAGRAIRKYDDLQMIHQLADLLGAQVAGTRSLIETGWVDPKHQIGLSGRTVKPKLIITCGVSGAIQFAAGMNQSECIIAINKDEKAPIFQIAHYGIVGDVYEIIPRMIQEIRKVVGGDEIQKN
jgi:electron transfer flavoprotein alpha subunit